MRVTEHLRSVCVTALLVLWIGSSVAPAVPVVWGVDEQKGELFSIQDYTQLANGSAAAGVTLYGRLKYERDNGQTRNIGDHIEALALEADGTAYMVVNDRVVAPADLGGNAGGPVLLKFNVNDASTTADNVVSVLGHINASDYGVDAREHRVSGLAVDPVSGALYALYRKNGETKTDRLLVVSKGDGSVLADLGEMAGLGEAVKNGEDIAFDSNGKLYVTDTDDGHLYGIDPDTGAIVAVVDGDTGDGECTGLAWDPENGRLVASDDLNDLLSVLTFGDGLNDVYGGAPELGDVEALDFLPLVSSGTGRGELALVIVNPSPAVPEPASAALVGLPCLIAAFHRRRR